MIHTRPFGRLEFRAERRPWHDHIGLWLSAIPTGTSPYQPPPHQAIKIEWEEITEENYHLDQGNLLSMRGDEAQTLMDELWRSGIRPTEGTGSAGSLAATQGHLEDMRRLVFGTTSESLLGKLTEEVRP